MNYIIKDDKEMQLAFFIPFFRMIIMVDKTFVDKIETPFLNNFKKFS